MSERLCARRHESRPRGSLDPCQAPEPQHGHSLSLHLPRQNSIKASQEIEFELLRRPNNHQDDRS